MSDSVIPWALACQVSLSMEFSRQKYWSGLHLLLQGTFPAQGLNLYLLRLLHWQVDSLLLSHLGGPQKTVGERDFLVHEEDCIRYRNCIDFAVIGEKSGK